MVYGKISGPDSMSETVQIFVWSRSQSVRILYESKKYFLIRTDKIQTNICKISGPDRIQIFVCILSVRNEFQTDGKRLCD